MATDDDPVDSGHGYDASGSIFMNRFGGESQYALQTRIARIHAVRELNGVPAGTYDVVLDNGQQEQNVPMLLPASSYMFRGGKRQFGASGIVPIASVGDNCIVMYLGSQVGLAQPFIMGFFSPRQIGTGGDYRNPKRVRPGSIVLSTPFGNGIVIRNGGIIEIEADANVRRSMTPASASATEITQSMISDYCRNYRLLTAGGEMRMGEIGAGKTSMHFKVGEFSTFGRTARQRASGGGGSERFVEVVWGSAGSGALGRETYSGPSGSVVLEQDGSGGWLVTADRQMDLRSGSVRIHAQAAGELDVTAVDETHTVLGQVTYEAPLFTVNSPTLINLNGLVLVGGGGLPSARISDLVIVGDRVGEIVTGSPKLIH